MKGGHSPVLQSLVGSALMSWPLPGGIHGAPEISQVPSRSGQAAAMAAPSVAQGSQPTGRASSPQTSRRSG